MSHTLTLELSDAAYTGIVHQAEIIGTSPASLAAASLEQQFADVAPPNGPRQRSEPERHAARQRFEQHFGAIDLGRTTGADNEGIDADLAREYADDHPGD